MFGLCLNLILFILRYSLTLYHSLTYFFFIHPPTSFVSFLLRFSSHDMLINDMSWSTFVHYLSLLTSSSESFHILFSPEPQDQFQPVTKHPLFKGIQTCSNDGSRHLPRVNNSDIEEKPRLFPWEYKWKTIIPVTNPHPESLN